MPACQGREGRQTGEWRAPLCAFEKQRFAPNLALRRAKECVRRSSLLNGDRTIDLCELTFIFIHNVAGKAARALVAIPFHKHQ
jgi:hypothetical protein